MIALQVLRDSIAAFRRPTWTAVEKIDKGDFERYLAVGVSLFESVTRVSEEWYLDVLGKREAFDPSIDRAMFDLYVSWAEQGAETASLIERLRSRTSTLKHADDFISCWQKSQLVISASASQQPVLCQDSMIAGLKTQLSDQADNSNKLDRVRTLAFRPGVFSKQDIADLAELRRQHGESFGRPVRPLRGVPRSG